MSLLEVAPESVEVVRTEAPSSTTATVTVERRRRLPRRGPTWPWLLAALFFVVYVVVGLWLAFGIDYAINDALSRAEAARSIAHSRDQHLMAVGVYWMPWPAFAMVPFMAVFSRLGIVELAWIMPTALAGALTIPQLANIGRTLRVGTGWTLALIVGFALNPYTLFFAGNGMSEAWLILFMTGSVAAYLRWATTKRARDLGALGLWLALAQFARYEALAFVLIFAIVVAWQSAPKRRIASGLVAALPGIFVLFAWTLTCFIIIDRGWWEVVAEANSKDPLVVIDDGHTLQNVLEFTTRLSLRMAPGIALLILLTVPREIAAQFRDRAKRAPLLATPLTIIAATFPAQQVMLLLSQDTFGDPRYWAPLALMSTLIGFVAIGAHVKGARVLVGMIAVACTAASAVTCFYVIGDRDASWVTGEWVVVEKLLGNEIERTEGDTLDELDLDTYREYARQVDALMGPDDILVLDSSRSQVYHLFSGRPKQIATDRDKDSERLLARAETRFTFAMLKLRTTGATPQSQAILYLIGQNNNRGSWVKVEGELGELGVRVGQELYRFVPREGPAASTPADTSSVPGS